MADELNVPTHRWYEPRNNIALPPNAVSPKYILANGVAMIDAWINSQPWGMPLYLFAASEPGWMYDNSDMSTLFQDSAGTTPVTAVGQPVGLQLDKSKGLVLGPELVTNGDFSAGSTGWSAPAGWSITGGVAVASVTNASLLSGSNVTAGRSYRVEFDVVSYTSGTLYVRIGAGTAATTTSSGRKSFILTATTTAGVEFYGGAVSATIDNISVKELPGTHRYQTTLNYCPTFARLPVTGRRNLLTYTEQFDNAAWAKTGVTAIADKLTASAGVSAKNVQQSGTVASVPNTFAVDAKAGTSQYLQLWNGASSTLYANFNLQTGEFTAGSGATASISSTGDGWYRCVITVTPATNSSFRIAMVSSGTAVFNESWTALGTETVFIRKAQLELGSTATKYQKVVSLYDITEAGVQTAYGLYYDGQDDFLVTPTITPGTDKVQVFMGVRKLSDAARAMVVELGGGVLNAFRVEAPSVAGSAQYLFTSQGTSSASPSYTNASVAAPNTSIITGLGDISGDTATLRVNGTQVSQSTSDQGTGNYLAYPVYFGRRGGTTLQFNGYTFREVGRFGPNLDAATLANVENWINQNTGAY